MVQALLICDRPYRSVELIVDKYSGSVFQQEYGGWTPLGLAVANNKVDCCQAILRMAGHRASELVNIMANENHGCAHVAAHRGYVECLQLLIDHGVDVSMILIVMICMHDQVNVVTDDTNECPYDAAMDRGRTACIDVLRPLTQYEYVHAWDE